MALDTYSDLQSEALDWMTRAGQSGKAPLWIKLAEAMLNRELGPVEDDEALTGTVGQRTLDVSSLSIVEPLTLWFTGSVGGDETELQKQPASGLAYSPTNDRPSMWAFSPSIITLDAPCSEAFSFRFHYRQRFALSDLAPTNWLLTNHPDIYLAATLVWGGGYSEDWNNGATWRGILQDGLSEVKHTIRQMNRGTLRVDRGLVAAGGYNINSDS